MSACCSSLPLRLSVPGVLRSEGGTRPPAPPFGCFGFGCLLLFLFQFAYLLVLPGSRVGGLSCV